MDTILLIDFSLSAVRLSRGDDSNDFVGALNGMRMGHQNYGRSRNQANRLPSRLAVCLAILPEEYEGIFKDLGCDPEPDTVLAEIGLGLLGIPPEAGHASRV
jgi:hypothetical protein